MNVTCTTTDCDNQGVRIDVPDDSGYVFCGPCGTLLHQPGAST